MSGQIGTLGKYQIIREIARSNDIVFEAYDPVMNRRVALKELAMPTGATSQQIDDRRTRFLREARAAGTLTHPNIVTIYEYGEDQGRNYIAMEFLEGHTLRNEVDTHGFIAVERAVEIADAILYALEYAHNHGVVHRDIKPDNVQLLPDGRVKITDFGIARLMFEPNLTMDGQVFGTPSYMSPEQIVGREIDARSDLFSVGVLLFEMISGAKPFPGDSVVSITYAIMNTTPSQPVQMTWPMWQVVERSLDKSPQLRFSSAAEMRVSLDAAMKASSGMVIDPIAPMQPMAYPAPPPNNPYVQPDPGLPHYPQPPTPFGQAPTGSFSYNPYGSGSQTSMGMPPTGGYVPPPIYYPPPPRQPLFKPETKRFFGKLGLTILVLGSFFGLVIALVTGLSSAIQRDARQRQDQNLMERLRVSQSKPVGQAIADYEAAVPKMTDPLNQAEANATLAVLYERRGKSALKNGNFDGAEADFKRASELDPANAAYPSDLGDLYGQLAKRASDPRRSADLWRFSAEQWAAAVALEKFDEGQNLNYRNGAIGAYMQLASVQVALGLRQEARATLETARTFAETNSSAAEEIQQRLNRI